MEMSNATRAYRFRSQGLPRLNSDEMSNISFTKCESRNDRVELLLGWMTVRVSSSFVDLGFDAQEAGRMAKSVWWSSFVALG